MKMPCAICWACPWRRLLTSCRRMGKRIASTRAPRRWSFRAPATGRYHVKLAGYTVWVGGGGIGRWFYEGQGAQKAPVYYVPLWHRPDLDEVWPGRNNEPIGLYASGNGQTRPIGACDFTPQPSICDMEVTLVAGESLLTGAMRLF